MSDRGYCRVTAVVFSLVAVAHLVRAVAGWPILLGTWAPPVSLSWLGALAAAALAAWGFRCASRGAMRGRDA